MKPFLTTCRRSRYCQCQGHLPFYSVCCGRARHYFRFPSIHLRAFNIHSSNL